MIRKWKFWAIVILLGAGAFLAWKALFRKAKGPAFQTVEVTRGRLDISVLATGVVQPENRLELKPPIAGRVESLSVEEGQRVHKGQMLAWLSSSERAALLDAARAKGAGELAHWEDLFKPTPLLAPLDGLIIVKSVVPGQVVAAQDVVLVMSDHLIVNTQVDETDIAQIKWGEKAEITLDAYPKETIPGRVVRLAYESKTVNNVTIYEVRVLPDQVPPYMRSGMTANVKFISEIRENVLLLPVEALRRQGEKSVALVYNPLDPKEPFQREVTLGLSDGKKAEVLFGLHEGEKVMIASFSKRKSEGPAPSNPFTPFRAPRPSGGGSRHP